MWTTFSTPPFASANRKVLISTNDHKAKRDLTGTACKFPIIMKMFSWLSLVWWAKQFVIHQRSALNAARAVHMKPTKESIPLVNKRGYIFYLVTMDEGIRTKRLPLMMVIGHLRRYCQTFP
jgi:hypothetical protein